MSTKRLARTVIEPGRTSFTKNERVFGNRAERRAARARGGLLCRDPDAADGEILPLREPLEICQHDKLAAIRRWLRAQADRPWGEVYADIRSRCDTRTTAGRHILYDHLLRDVEGNGVVAEWVSRWRAEWRERFWVDEEGMLRHRPSRARPPRERWWTSDAASAFTGDRRVREIGAALFWMVPVGACLSCDRAGCAHVRYRQGHRLDEREAARWRSLAEVDRRARTWVEPGAEGTDEARR